MSLLSLKLFVYFRQLLSGLSLIVGFPKNFGIVILFTWLSQQFKVDKTENTPIFYWFEMTYCSKSKVFWLTSYVICKTKVETTTLKTYHIIVPDLLNGLILKTCLCCHLCPPQTVSLFLLKTCLYRLPLLSRRWTFQLTLQMVYFSEV